MDGLDGRARAFVQVQNGCDHRCTFCIIPFGRGNSRSVPVDDVVAQVRRLVENGYREVVLTGVDITSYDASGARLGALVKRILREVPELARLRLSSIDSVEADADLIDALANEAAVDAASASVIAGRRRSDPQAHEAAAFAQRCHRLLRFQVRRLRPDMAFGADIIAGFPTETEAMFARSLDLVDECGLTQLHVFPFSARPGTPAARMPQLDACWSRNARAVCARRARRRWRAISRAKSARDAGCWRNRAALGRTEQFMPVRMGASAGAGRHS